MDQKSFSSLVEASPLLKMIFQNAESISILIVDSEGIILDVSYGLHKCFGYTGESLIGKNYSLLFVEEERLRQLPEKELKKTLETGSSDDKGFFQKKDLKCIWVHRESILAKDENGRSFIIQIIHDIQSIKLLEELRENHEELQQIIKDRDVFTYMIFHDLQSPVSNIDGLVNVLKGSYPSPEEFGEVMGMIDLSMKRLKTKLAELYIR